MSESKQEVLRVVSIVKMLENPPSQAPLIYLAKVQRACIQNLSLCTLHFGENECIRILEKLSLVYFHEYSSGTFINSSVPMIIK